MNRLTFNYTIHTSNSSELKTRCVKLSSLLCGFINITYEIKGDDISIDMDAPSNFPKQCNIKDMIELFLKTGASEREISIASCIRSKPKR